MNKPSFHPFKELFAKTFYPENYPQQICKECGIKYGYCNKSAILPYYPGKCGWCHEQKEVTQPKDFGYPPYQEKKQ